MEQHKFLTKCHESELAHLITYMNNLDTFYKSVKSTEAIHLQAAEIPPLSLAGRPVDGILNSPPDTEHRCAVPTPLPEACWRCVSWKTSFQPCTRYV